MNALQKTIFEIIVNISNTPGAFDHGNCIFNPIRSFIARYSLASDEYFVSETAYSLFGDHKLELPLRRSRIKKKKKDFIYEHAVPSCVVLEKIIESDRSADEIREILSFADCVTLLTQGENQLISGLYNSRMPEGWNYFKDSRFARYEICNVKIQDEKIPVIGALQN